MAVLKILRQIIFSLVVTFAMLMNASAADMDDKIDAQTQSVITFARSKGFIKDKTFWSDAQSGQEGVVEHAPWKQLLRYRFVAKDSSGTVVGEGMQPFGSGVVRPCKQQLYILDESAQREATLVGKGEYYWDGIYDVLDAFGRKVMGIKVSNNGSLVVFRGKNGVTKCASLIRDISDKYVFELTLQNECDLSRNAWVILGGYFSVWSDRLLLSKLSD